MTIEKVDALVVGAGQAGVAMSEHLSANGLSHVVLEKGRIAERWRSERWDSLVANGPAWHDRFPGLTFKGNPDAFVPKEQVADYFVDYVEKIKAPVKSGVEVTSATRLQGKPGFLVETTEGTYEAGNVIAATGAFQTPVFPDLIPAAVDVHQIHSASYKNPEQLPQGAVLVVGAGSSGTQIAEELLTSGRKVFLSVGPHDRPPRSYRGRDFVWWLGVLNKWDAEATPEADHVTIAVSGANGGHTIDFRKLAERGMLLMGRTEGYEGGKLKIAPDLTRNLSAGDANYLAVLDEADAFAERNGLDLPEEPEARILGKDTDCISNPIFELDLQDAGITSVIWATGFKRDYGWLKVDIFDASGAPLHKRGISNEPGVYFLGLPWQTRRGSSFIWGVWYDAKYLADHMTKQKNYLAYSNAH
ncbi:FAD-dependent oxidoreductase [Roseibium polysiphoniae]|uniref:FAD-dependent oxidoreductase n=1 Tax=Roseibium polysiphoniae TaxID=2571221 RepID=A0A944CC99_9HYPH|nr:NAD(P)/FAD-dependent oxidoreductase [Roseibium polysiphoniae]MBS8259864.1 FAD-dependent oxidoreductase [Roseibium polysiphoniae]